MSLLFHSNVQIGLAVSDIKDTMREATLKQHVERARLVIACESGLPDFLRKRFMESGERLPKNECPEPASKNEESETQKTLSEVSLDVI